MGHCHGEMISSLRRNQPCDKPFNSAESWVDLTKENNNRHHHMHLMSWWDRVLRSWWRLLYYCRATCSYLFTMEGFNRESLTTVRSFPTPLRHFNRDFSPPKLSDVSEAMRVWVRSSSDRVARPHFRKRSHGRARNSCRHTGHRFCQFRVASTWPVEALPS